METKTKVILAVIATFVVIGTFFNEPTHYCESKEIKMYCNRLSSTERRCYPVEETTKGYKDCSEGWKEIPIIESNREITNNPSASIHCNNKGCF